MGLDTILFNDVSAGQLLPWILAAVLLYAVFRIYKLLFGKKKVNLQHRVYFVCSSCGWEGHISKFGTCCPKCGAATGDLGAGL